MSGGFKAVVFDLDGTLLDTLVDIANAANDVLAERGLPTHPVETFHRFIGDGVTMLFTRALPATHRTEAIISDCVRQFSAAYDRRWNQHSAPYPGITTLLETLAARGLRLTVLSNKPHLFTVKFIDQFFPHTHFEVVFGQREGVPRKPDPAAANEIVALLNIPAAETLYLGDSGVDMQTANSAGMFAVGAAWGYRSREELQSQGARQIIENPLELLLWLNDAA